MDMGKYLYLVEEDDGGECDKMFLEDITRRKTALQDVLHAIGAVNLRCQFVIVKGDDLIEDGPMPEKFSVLCLFRFPGRIVLQDSDHVENEVVRSESLNEAVLIVVDHHANDLE